MSNNNNVTVHFGDYGPVSIEWNGKTYSVVDDILNVKAQQVESIKTKGFGFVSIVFHDANGDSYQLESVSDDLFKLSRINGEELR